MWPTQQVSADSVTFTEKLLIENFIFCTLIFVPACSCFVLFFHFYTYYLIYVVLPSTNFNPFQVLQGWHIGLKCFNEIYFLCLTVRISDVFRGQRKGALGTNGLILLNLGEKVQEHVENSINFLQNIMSRLSKFFFIHISLHKFIKDFFSKQEQIRSFLWICLHLLKKFFMGNLVSCSVCLGGGQAAQQS